MTIPFYYSLIPLFFFLCVCFCWCSQGDHGWFAPWPTTQRWPGRRRASMRGLAPPQLPQSPTRLWDWTRWWDGGVISPCFVPQWWTTTPLKKKKYRIITEKIGHFYVNLRKFMTMFIYLLELPAKDGVIQDPVSYEEVSHPGEHQICGICGCWSPSKKGISKILSNRQWSMAERENGQVSR